MSKIAGPADDYGNSVADTATKTGNTALNSFNPSGFASDTYGSLFGGKPTNLLGEGGTQQTGINNYIDSYKKAIAANPSVTQLYNQANENFNVPTLQTNATNLNNQVLNTPQQTLDRARGFNYDANQVAEQTGQTLGRLSPLATAAQNSANTAEGLASNWVQAGMAQNNLNLMPIQQQGSMMGELYARQAAGFTTAMQSELEGYLRKMDAGVKLSDTEMSRANTLATAQTSYQNTLATTQASIKTAEIQNQFHTLNPNQTLYNAYNGANWSPYSNFMQTLK